MCNIFCHHTAAVTFISEWKYISNGCCCLCTVTQESCWELTFQRKLIYHPALLNKAYQLSQPCLRSNSSQNGPTNGIYMPGFCAYRLQNFRLSIKIISKKLSYKLPTQYKGYPNYGIPLKRIFPLSSNRLTLIIASILFKDERTFNIDYCGDVTLLCLKILLSRLAIFLCLRRLLKLLKMGFLAFCSSASRIMDCCRTSSL